MTVMSEQEINNILQKKDFEALIEESEFNDIILYKKYEARYARFRYCSFKGKIHIQEVPLKKGLRFDHSEFSKDVTFSAISIDDFDRKLSPEAESFVFRDCTFKARLSISGGKIQRALAFYNCTFEQGIDISNLVVENDGIKFSDCTINKVLRFDGLALARDLSFHHNGISANSSFQNCSLGALWYSNMNVVTGTVHITGCKFVESLTFDGSKYGGTVFLADNEFQLDGININESTFENSFSVSYNSGHLTRKSDIKSCSIRDSVFSSGFLIDGAPQGQPKHQIAQISIASTSVLKGSLSFKGIDIGYLTITGHNTSASLLFKNIEVKVLRIEGLINEGGLIFSNLTATTSNWSELQAAGLVKSEFRINDSNMGKAQLFQSDLSTFQNIDIDSVILTDISTSGVKWFDHQQIDNNKVKNLENGYKAAKRLGDKIRSVSTKNELLALLNSRREAGTCRL